jgi:cytochrome P450
MALNPDLMRKAQEELDKVVGNLRLPDFSDQVDLPYTSAIVKEVLRWGCPLPIGVPKRATVNDTYHGYCIPVGATVVENIW